EDGQLPGLRLLVVPEDADAAVAPPHLEVAVLRRQPAVDDLPHLDGTRAEEEAARRLFAPVARIALDADPHDRNMGPRAIVYTVRMKLRLFHAPEFWLKPFSRSLAAAPDAAGELSVRDTVMALVHAEPGDAADPGRVVTKAIKNIKWVAGKFASKRAVLHFFS